MAKYRLRTYDVSPPGGYLYVQPPPLPRSFDAQPMIEAQAQIVAAYRQGNNLARADYVSCLADVDAYNCQRLGNNPQFVTQDSVGNVVPAQGAMGSPGGCKGCGVRLS